MIDYESEFSLNCKEQLGEINEPTIVFYEPEEGIYVGGILLPLGLLKKGLDLK